MSIAPLRNLACAVLFLIPSLVLSEAAHAVVILDSTWEEEGGTEDDPAAGFTAALDLAAEPQFQSVIALSTDGESWGEASATWIGNDDEHAYLLSAGHIFDLPAKVDDYVARAPDGHVVKIDKLWVHPLWNGDVNNRAGYDFTILRLEEPLEDTGPQPTIYTGTSELGHLITFVGYGTRGIGSVGEDEKYDEGSDKAAADGIVDIADDPIDPVPPEDEDAGGTMTIALPKEDGSVEVPTGGATEPPDRLAGLLGSGDSGGSAWMKVGGVWEIVGVNSNGTGEAQYGDTSTFGRVTFMQDWIEGIFPGAQFGDEE
ncbi:hypothetical protein [Oryzibacter oryziterrae]|uniref:hypothetical protein n=1 Tax=Oryzibacter oryziterrae TaxID=2766474 RepID=UPI001F36F602|nr:hypothetical protein [Oryzibacter oryziterrae]